MGFFGTLFGDKGSSNITGQDGKVTHIEHSGSSSFCNGQEMQTSGNVSTFGGQQITGSGNSYTINGQQYIKSGNTLFGPGGQSWTSGCGDMSDQQARDIIFSQNQQNNNGGFGNNGFGNGGF